MQAQIKEARSSKKVGILIHSGTQLFSNGIIQNAYFIMQCFERLGLSCQFLCHEENPLPFEYKGLTLQQISTNQIVFNPREFHTIITVSRGISKEMYTYLKSFKIYVVGFICGNSLMHDCEDFVRGPFFKGQSTHIGKGSPVDELWVIPSYKHALEYISLIRGAPSYTVPHLWSPCIVEAVVDQVIKKPIRDLYYNYANHYGKKIDILVLEPNIALFKNAWIPIVAAEHLHKQFPELIDNVYVFNFPEIEHPYAMVENLTIHNKVRKFKRLAIPDILVHFNQKDTFPVIVSHQVLNGLNYIYYEALFYGWPLVHNSNDMGTCGYKYSENDFIGCANAIMDAYTSHNRRVESYKDEAREFMSRVDPLDPSVGKIWDQLINAGLSKSLAAAE
jgi:hypothetical protein